MTEATLEQYTRDPLSVLQAAQQGRVIVTREGQPVAVVVGLEYKDEEDFRLEASPEFWRMIEERRKEPTFLLKDVEAELFND